MFYSKLFIPLLVFDLDQCARFDVVRLVVKKTFVKLLIKKKTKKLLLIVKRFNLINTNSNVFIGLRAV
jgi:hypothetical protein